MSSDDQKDFNKEYEKWQKANAKSDREDIDKHARKMEEIMARYNIPPDTPFDTIATSYGYSRHNDVRQFQGRFSPDDQKRFDKAYEHWLNDRRKRDRDDIAKDEGKMQELMARYNIPRDVPYDALSSGGRGY
jgi:ubiquitin-protein ligase